MHKDSLLFHKVIHILATRLYHNYPNVFELFQLLDNQLAFLSSYLIDRVASIEPLLISSNLQSNLSILIYFLLRKSQYLYQLMFKVLNNNLYEDMDRAFNPWVYLKTKQVCNKTNYCHQFLCTYWDLFFSFHHFLFFLIDLVKFQFLK